MNVLNNISDISRNYYHHLTTYQNVKGVGVGYKFINGIETNELCIHILVKRKINEAYLTCNNIIPKTYMGIKTDVIEIGIPRITGFPEKYRPLKGGCGIYTKNAKLSGTLGCIVVRKGVLGNKYFILSNNHVLADSNAIPLGTEVIQPISGKFEGDVVAKLSQFKAINFPHGAVNPKNFVDCAIAEVTNKSLISKEVLKIGTLKGSADLKLNTHVKKAGFKSGLTDGRIVTINTTLDIDFSGKNVFFANQAVALFSSLDGDSGSVVVNDDNKVVGLLFARSLLGASFINDINLVLKVLNVDIYK